MSNSKTYMIRISSDQDLLETWKDDRVPHISFTFNERSMDECYVDSNEDTYASYNTWIVEEEFFVTYSLISETNTILIKPGEYGLRGDVNSLAD